jgi:Ca2+-binding EF-hand superfamily protein
MKVKSTIICGALLAMCATASAANNSFATGGYARQLSKLDTMKMIDANGDHMVTREEFDKYYSDLFDELDADHDGSLDQNEWIGMKKAGSNMFGEGGYARELSKLATMKMMDSNGDHKVSKDEFVNFHKKYFDMVDTKKAGMIDAQQWAAMLLSK